MARQERRKPVEQEVYRRQSITTHENIEEEHETAVQSVEDKPQETLTPEVRAPTPALSISDKDEEESSTRASSVRRESTDVRTRRSPQPARRDTTDSLAARHSPSQDTDSSNVSQFQLIAPGAPIRAASAGPTPAVGEKRWANARPPSSPYAVALGSSNSHDFSLVSCASRGSSAPLLLPMQGTSSGSSSLHHWEEYNPSRWSSDFKEDDDDFHDPEKDISPTTSTTRWYTRASANLGTLGVLIAGVLMLFLGYPLIVHFVERQDSTKGGFNLGGTNASGQIANFASMGLRSGLIDPETPLDVRDIKGTTGQPLTLVFSDEFNSDGRSFYPGDDPYWEALDLWAHGTGDYEWYDPVAVTTSEGALQITVDQIINHNLNFRSGHIQSWNKFCFSKAAYLEVSVRLPGSPRVSGFWPAVWSMGNLGRANYGATTHGTWPYSYDECDVGANINQTTADGLGPIGALESGSETVFNNKYKMANGRATKSISWAPGQKLSRCTCPGEDHPGPKHSDGTFVGRSAPEIDVFEAQVDNRGGGVSQSGQFQPSNAGYWLNNATLREYELYDPTAVANAYRGNVIQQSASVVPRTNQEAYELTGNIFAKYGYEYKAGREEDGAYITWINDGRLSWRLNAAAVGADPRTNISAREIPREPMYILINLALSSGFGRLDWDQLIFPARMSVDYVRVYQPPDDINVGCDPPDFPTSDYIQRHIEAYTNANLSIWGGTPEEAGHGANWPLNSQYPGGCNAEPRNYPGPLRSAAVPAAAVPLAAITPAAVAD